MRDLYEWFHAVIDLANTVEHAPCWGCGAWMMTPHIPSCRVARQTADRYLIKNAWATLPVVKLG